MRRTSRSVARIAAAALVVVMGSALPALAQDGEATAREKAARSITGRVLGSEGQGLANARVFVREVGGAAGQPRTVRTDAEGRFTVPELAPRAYRVWVDAPAYVMPDDPAGVPPPYYWPGGTATISLVKGGVVTGRVTTADGEPIVSLPVRAVKVLEKNHQVRPSRENVLTDDRGVYRIYGLQAGEYRVVAGGGSAGFFGMAQGFPQESEVQTYYPSSTYETASFVRVGPGDEVPGIDIRYRGLKGHAVSGTFDGALPEGQTGAVASLYRPDGGMESSSLSFGVSEYRGFALYGVADGQYDLVAQCWGPKGLTAVSKPVRVTVRGADVAGLRLVLEGLASLQGTVVLEPLAADPRPGECPKAAGGAASESVLAIRRDERDASDPGALFGDGSAEAAPGADGAFAAESLRAGVYRVEPRPPNDAWYVKSIHGAKPSADKSPPDVGRDGLALAAGQKAAGVTVTLAEGAAAVRGRVVAAVEGQPVPTGIRVVLVPAEVPEAENALRYVGAWTADSGEFTIRNVPPGRYRVVARVLDEAARIDATRRPPAWDQKGRARLRAEAAAAKQELELQPCQQAADLVVRIQQNRER
jgi:hypothetical protein